MRITPLILLTIATAVAVPGTAKAQEVSPSGQAADSTEARGIAEEAQHRFERLRQARIPSTFFRSGVGCAETIGRFCHWDDEDEEWTPPPEHEDLPPARAELLSVLDSVAELLPQDGWITGLRVHYRLEQGDFDAAMAAANDCASSDWWCGALAGYVHHHNGETELAERSFAASLAAMPYAQRCDWNDLELLLERSLRDEYGEMRCSLRESLHAVIWDLADPLYIVPGNDRHTEHLSRLVAVEIMRQGTTPFNMDWRPDVAEIVMRFGWPVGWEKSLTPGRGNVVSSRGRAFARGFMPPATILMADTGATWDLDESGSHTAYLPSYLNRIFNLDHQIALFRRGDSAVVAAAYAFGRQLGEGATIQAALTIVDPGVDRSQTYNPAAEAENFFLAISTDSTMVVGLEAYSALDSVAGRARILASRPVVAAGGIGISDILLFRPREPLPESVEEAVFLAHYSTIVKPSEPLGLYWEVYGLANAGSSVATEVTVVREGRGLFRGLFETVGLARPRNPEVRYEWADGAGDVTAVYPRAVVVDLNDTEAGNYIVRVVATPENGAPAIAERRIEIIQDD